MKNILKLIGIAILVYILTRIDWSELFEILSATQVYYVVLSILLIIPVVVVRTRKWEDILIVLWIGSVSF